MGRPALQPDEIHEFRDRLCDAALRLFAEHGYEGFTLRSLGAALDCSPTTPYRYFQSKADIYAAVCAKAFERFCTELERGDDPEAPAWDRIRAQGRSYVSFARRNPHAYRVMFNLEAPRDPSGTIDHEEYSRPVWRSWESLLGCFEAASRAGELEGDPAPVANSFWASLHGVMALDLSGRRMPGIENQTLVDEVIERFERAYRPVDSAGGPASLSRTEHAPAPMPRAPTGEVR